MTDTMSNAAAHGFTPRHAESLRVLGILIDTLQVPTGAPLRADLEEIRERITALLPEDRPMSALGNPTVPEVLPLIRAYYAKPGNSVGGHLHITLEDGNVDDDSVRYCIESSRWCGDDDGVALGEILLRMSRTQRRKLYHADKGARF